MTGDTGKGASNDTPPEAQDGDAPEPSGAMTDASADGDAAGRAVDEGGAADDAEAADQTAAPTDDADEADEAAAEDAPLELPPPPDETPASELPPKPVPPSDRPMPPPPPAPPPASVDGALLDLPPPASVPLPAPLAAPKVVPAAQIVDVTPDHGPVIGGTKVNLHGQHLYRESIVRFDGMIATPIGATEPSDLRVATPPRKSAGAVDITVQNPGSEEVVLAKGYRYEPLPAPKITTVAPNQGGVKGGTELTITGENFVETTVVLLNGVEASSTTIVDGSTIDLKTRPGKQGQWLDVTVRNPDGKKDEARRAFQYDERYD